MTSAWGLANIATHYDNETYYCIMFGVNDQGLGVPTQQMLDSLLGMYNYVNTDYTTPIMLVNTMVTPNWRGYDVQHENITLIQERYRAHDIPFVRAYDAVDTIPGNCIADEVDVAYYVSDGVHLTAAGHRALADYLWASLQTPNAGFAANTTAVLAGDPMQFVSNSTGIPRCISGRLGTALPREESGVMPRYIAFSDVMSGHRSVYSIDYVVSEHCASFTADDRLQL